jgi:FKBP-type peptidyl-prolyl cis-trans isomerase FkpA
MNKKLLFVLAAITLSLTFLSCIKSQPDTQSNCVPNNTGVPTAAEIASLQTYITANAIAATQDSRGFFYSIVAPGSGTTPTTSSTVTVKYIGKLENGTIFDQSQSGATFQLSQLIKGWQYGIPLIKKGGSIKLYLPPTLGYGCNAVGGIPAGSNLIFTVDLVDVQ